MVKIHVLAARMSGNGSGSSCSNQPAVEFWFRRIGKLQQKDQSRNLPIRRVFKMVTGYWSRTQLSLLFLLLLVENDSCETSHRFICLLLRWPSRFNPPAVRK